MQTNCKNCGAPIGTGRFCPYCGTPYPREVYDNLLVREIRVVPYEIKIERFGFKGVIDDLAWDLDGGEHNNARNTMMIAKVARLATENLARHLLETKAPEMRLYPNVPGIDGTMFDLLVNVGITKDSIGNAGFIVKR